MKTRNRIEMSRRQLAAVMLLPAPLLSQAPAADELPAAKQQIQRTAAQLRNFKVPAATEPSFVFKP
jgi:hypothetical protein